MEHYKKEITAAVAFAQLCHSGQYRKDDLTPYITHPFAVWELVRSWGIKGLVESKACLCHDIREECPNVSVEDLQKGIGAEAAMVCEELTFIPNYESPTTISGEKDAYMRSFDKKCLAALVVKVADRICNTRDFQRESPRYAPKYWAKADPLFETFNKRHAEVSNVYGPAVLARIDKDILEMDNLLRMLKA